jgi:hypothetical protein
VLIRRITSQDELASLLERVLTVGLVLDEVRVDGRLDGALLRFLRWRHRHLPEHAAVWLDGTEEDVYEFPGDCCRLGLGIEQVRLSRPPARVLVGRRPRGG